MIRLEAVNEENWRLPLEVSESQRRFVGSGMSILARAYAYRDARSKAYILVHDDTPVGMALYYDGPKWNAYVFSHLFIDARYQGNGYGKQAVDRILAEMRADGKYSRVVLCYCDGNDAAKNLYEQFGFVETDRDEDEIMMERAL